MEIFENVKLSKEELTKNKTRLYWTGALMLITGFIALWMPMVASFAIEMVVGWLLVIAGGSQAYGAYKAFKDKTGGWWEVFSSVVSFIAGFLFITRPLAGVFTLSIMLSAYFLVDGVTKIVQYWSIRHIDGAIWTLVSGILSVVLAWMMWSNMVTGLAMVGVVLGVDFIFGGVSMILLGRGCAEMAAKEK
ncbi:MAG: DUF308 domain-containing protein [Synergistaceae bacterium]|nr:DUF308 domain-containing protein [Synergistaceae bacterium]